MTNPHHHHPQVPTADELRTAGFASVEALEPRDRLALRWCAGCRTLYCSRPGVLTLLVGGARFAESITIQLVPEAP